MAARLCIARFCGALQPLATKSMVPERCLSLSVMSMLKRPTFEGPALPKRPLNAYALFVMDNKNSVRTMEGNRLDVKKLGEMWKGLSETDRNAYNTRYVEEKRLYKERMEQFMRDLGGEEEQEAYRKSLAEYRAKRRAYLKQFRLKKLGLIKPRKVSGYQVFAGERLREAGGHGLNVPLIKEIPTLWKALSEEERKGYQSTAEELYETRIAEYNERVEKAKREGIIAEDKEEKKPKATKTTAKKKPAANKKKAASAKKKTASSKRKITSTKKKGSSSRKKTTAKKKTEDKATEKAAEDDKETTAKKKTEDKATEKAAEDDKDEEWVHSDDED